MKILQIIPRLPPAMCGVGDYAHELAREWRRHGIESCFLGGEPAWRGENAEFPSEAIAARSSAALCASLTRLHAQGAFDTVVVQFSGYGFARRGAPVWLLRGLESWLRQMPGVPLLTMFHELYASGPMTSSAFWLSPLQKWVSAQIAQLSKRVRTNRAASATWLGHAAPQHANKIFVQPVFSNLGEAKVLVPPSQRENTLVFFGYHASAKEDFWGAFHHVVLELRPDRILALGPKIDLSKSSLKECPIEQTGHLSATEMSAVLSRARYGYLDYFPSYLGKSGVLAAYAAHGVASILARPNESAEDGLCDHREFVSWKEARSLHDSKNADAIAEGLHSWYLPHNVSATADAYIRQLDTLC